MAGSLSGGELVTGVLAYPTPSESAAMALLPCDRHGSISRGRLAGMYPVLLRDGRRLSKYRRYCLDCMHTVLQLHSKDWRDSALIESRSEPTGCSSCGTEVNGSGALSRFYVTAYLNGKERRDYDAYYCADCTSLCIQEFQLDA